MQGMFHNNDFASLIKKCVPASRTFTLLHEFVLLQWVIVGFVSYNVSQSDHLCVSGDPDWRHFAK